MKKIIHNRNLFVIVTIIVLAILILSLLDQIDLGLWTIPIALPYLFWLFSLMRSVK